MNGIYGYGNGYGYAPPYTPQMGTGAQMPQRCQVIKVNGRNGADAFRMAADSSVLLLDENDPIVWLILPTLTRRGYSYFVFLLSFALKLLAAVAAVHGMKFIGYIGFAFFEPHYSP